MRTPVTQQITDWLENLGIGQYAERFAENEIDFPYSERSDGPRS